MTNISETAPPKQPATTSYCSPAPPPTHRPIHPQALPTYVGSLAFVSGFLIRFDDMPVYWRWYSRANPLAYSFTACEWRCSSVQQLHGLEHLYAPAQHCRRSQLPTSFKPPTAHQ